MSWDNNHPNTSGIKLNLDFRSKDKDEEERKRQEDDLKLFKELTDQGYSPEQSQYMIKKRRETGQIDTTNPPAQPTTPVGDGALRIDNSSPRPLPGEMGIGPRSTLSKFPQKAELSGENIYVNAATGDEVRRETNGTKTTKVIKVGSTGRGGAGGGKTPLTPEQVAYKDYYDKVYLPGIKDGTADPNDPVIRGGAHLFGLNFEDIPSIENPAPSANFIQKFLGITPSAPPPTPATGRLDFSSGKKKPSSDGPDTSNDPELHADVEAAKAAVAKGLVSEEEAHARLVKKHGKKIPPL